MSSLPPELVYRLHRYGGIAVAATKISTSKIDTHQRIKKLRKKNIKRQTCPPDLLIDDDIAVVATEIVHHPARKFPHNTKILTENQCREVILKML